MIKAGLSNKSKVLPLTEEPVFLDQKCTFPKYKFKIQNIKSDRRS